MNQNEKSKKSTDQKFRWLLLEILDILLENRLIRYSLILMIVLFATVFSLSRYADHTSKNSYGRPIVFVSRYDTVRVEICDTVRVKIHDTVRVKINKTPDIFNVAYACIIKIRDKKTGTIVSNDGFLRPSNPDYLEAKRSIYQDSSSNKHQNLKKEKISIANISGLELKLYYGEKKWLCAITLSFEKVSTLYEVDFSEFKLYKINKKTSATYECSDIFSDSTNNKKIIDVSLHDEAVDLNGIEITHKPPAPPAVWLLGFNGILYKHDINKQDSLYEGGPLKQRLYSMPIAQFINLGEKTDLRLGWQSLDIIEYGAPPNSIRFLATNSIDSCLYVFDIDTVSSKKNVKTGYQQIGLIIGVVVSTLVIGWTLQTLDGMMKFQGMTHAIGSDRLPAPQATLMATIIKGLLARDLPWGLVFVGMFISVVVELCGVRSLSFAVGAYLPISTTAPIFVGGMMKVLADRMTDQKDESEVSSGMLYSTGLVAGGSLIGVLIALLSGVEKGDSHKSLITYIKDDVIQIKGWESLGSVADLIGIAFFAGLCFLLLRAARQKLE